MIETWIILARAHAPFLAIAAPAIGAALALLAPERRSSWALAACAAIVGALAATDLFARFAFGETPVMTAPLDIALRADGVGLFAAPIVGWLGVFAILASPADLSTNMPSRSGPFAMALLCCIIAGWQGALFAGDLIGLSVAAATAWLAAVGLLAIASDRNRGALTGAMRMLTAGGVAGALLLVGAGFFERSVGAPDLSAIAGADVRTPSLAGVGIGLVLLALCVKSGVAPLNVWVGAAVGRAPGVTAMTLYALSVVGALGVLTRVAALTATAPAIGDGIAAMLCAFGVASVVICSIQAIGARNVRRLFAYGCGAQAGCVLVSLALGSPAGVAAALVQMFALAAAALALFGGASVINETPGLSALDGLGRRAPFASAAIVIGALSLMGAPLTVGFLGRWRLIEAGVGGGWWWAAGAVIVASLAAVFYGGRVIERLYFRRAESVAERNVSAWRMTLAPALAAAIVATLVGVQPALLLRAADAAAHAITEQAP